MEFVYPLGLMSAVAFSWGVMLTLVDPKPIERKWMLLPTILVVFLMVVVGVYAVLANVLPFSRIIPSSSAVIVVLSLLIVTYFKTRSAWTLNVIACIKSKKL